MRSDDLERLVRWEDSGGTWQVLHRRPDALDIGLVTCGGDETMDTISSAEPDLLEYVGDRMAGKEPRRAVDEASHPSQ